MNNQIFFNLYNLSHQSLALDWVIVFCAKYLPYLAVFFILIYIFYQYIGEFDWQRPFNLVGIKIKEILFAIGMPALSWGVANILKDIFSHPRPFILFADKVTPLFTHGAFDSFPSGHATFFAALATSLFFVDKKLGWFYVLIALIVGLARIIVGIHFPSDILFGYILGFVISLIFNLIFKYKQNYNA